MNIRRLDCLSALGLSALAALTIASAGIAEASAPRVTESIEPAHIDLGEASRLTIAASGSDASEITPPMVNGLEFVAVGQSERIESVNGVTTSTKAVTYQVIPREAGVYTIPGAASGIPPVVLTVNPGSAGSGPSRGSATAQIPQGASGLVPTARAGMNADGSAFVRLRLAKHELYVGETIPVDIEVGMRDGFVASLNGLPTLNGDEFTLNKLSSEPEKTEDVIDGKPFTVLTWHSALAAVKPGTLSLTVETPLTVRMRTRSNAGAFGDAGLDDFFNDPMFQSFFGASTEKDITVASKPANFTVLALPSRDQPANFSGAVGHFTVNSDLSDEKAAVGEPVTLRMRISGTGNFDRVSSPMLRDVAGWKTYAPTASFKPSDSLGFRGVKTFEQPVMATQPGAQSLPPLTFSWFDPSTGQYTQARTSPLPVDIAPAPKDSAVAHELRPPASPSALAQDGSASVDAAAGGLRADHVVNGGGAASMTPYYYQPEYLAVPSALLLALSGAWFWQSRREQASADAVVDGGRPSLDPQPLLNVMDDARAAGDADLFFKSARAALQRDLASKWQLSPEAITPEEVDTRLGPNSDVARLFTLADETAYAGVKLTALDYQQWKQFVVGHISTRAMS
jgi:hypothetical protein